LLRIVSALVVMLVFFAVYCASGIVAGARLFESVFGLSYAQALWWGAAATILYTLVGGFLAVSWTDTVQATLMIFALILTPVIVILSIGGVGDSLRIIEQVDPAKLDWFKGGELGLVGIVSLLAWGLGYFGQPHILARFMAADSLAVIPQARRIGMAWMVLCLFGAMATGFFGIAYFAQHPEQAGTGQREPRARVHFTVEPVVQSVGRRGAAVGDPGRDHEHAVLPVAGLLQCADRGLLPWIPAATRQ
jgi:sodium/proline symporter